MRVVVLSAAYPAPSEPERAIFVENLTRRQSFDGAGSVEFRVVAPRVRLDDPTRETRSDLPVRRFSYPGGDRRLKEFESPSRRLLAAYAFSCWRALRAEVRGHRADCILCHWVLPTGAVASISGRPFVVVAHGSDLNVYARTSRLGRRLALRTLRRAARVVVVSEALRTRCVDELKVPSERVEVLSMGVDEAFCAAAPAGGDRQAARAAVGLDPELPVVLYVGDLTDAKGVRELLESWRIIVRRGVAAQLVLVGDGPLRGFVDRSDVRQVRAIGRLSQAALPSWYRACDFFTLPSHGEGAPVSIMEALASGAPVVATCVGGVPELLEGGRWGRLVPPADVEALAGAFTELLRESETLAQLRHDLAQMPRDRFSLQPRARRLNELLREVVDER